ncbi:hypothetical protein LOZ57_000685 [Ophidiomyces ophidiicola]|uniref:uncharacterized protein n=1 Tax=Ophidiomyces ophidiicola TaxID=1387563 RepID=UPI0020C20F4D|nr:uncharacterized protein LOZ57_000685 [Ophidiomyces ophidiicola]KAI1952606.1 hypothetical protein LOZ57_000685 [Ophidiomyces ophidiicola]KAI2048763.1 hypothetical protein LOZ43_005332 [Ophidiomyces ophidiicola]
MASALTTPIAAPPASPLPLAPALTSRGPALSAKPIAIAGSPAPLTQCSVTSKEWVIPPRPKPGRKPATDTPPTKRKAQNRAAQRAFRERRAARVGELEEQIKKTEEENDEKETVMKARINSLSKQLEDCRTELLWWKKRCHELENDVTTQKNARQAAVDELQSIKSHSNKGALPSGGCDRCSSTRCRCIDDAFGPSTVSLRQDEVSAPKRPKSPQQDMADKRQRPGPSIKAEPEELEIDFTSRFAVRRPSRNEVDAVSPTALFDPCGFCQDGTPCICAEMAADQSAEKERQLETNKLAPIQNMSQFTPPPSDGDVFSESLPSLPNKANPCANGPGTCAQCLSDPRSTLFCKSLAASRSVNGGDGCCGSASLKGGCCQTRSTSRNAPGDVMLTDNPRTAPPITLSCADTFTTLSRHPNFSRASDELNTWLPRLHTLPIPRGLSSSVNNRPAMEVEAASVMGVLRYFDRRFAN